MYPEHLFFVRKQVLEKETNNFFEIHFLQGALDKEIIIFHPLQVLGSLFKDFLLWMELLGQDIQQILSPVLIFC